MMSRRRGIGNGACGRKKALNVRLITGYRDSAAIYLAMESGEVSGRTNELSSIMSTRPGWLAGDGKYKLLLQYARATRLASLADVPTARELAPNGKARALIQFTEAPFTMAWPYAAPPGLPADRSAALRDAFGAVHRDPRFLAEAKTVGIAVSPVAASMICRARQPTCSIMFGDFWLARAARALTS